MTAAGDKIQAAEPEDVERLMTRKEREGGKIPMPGPIPTIKLKPKASNKEIEAGLRHLRVPGPGGRAAHHARRLPVLRRSELDHPLRGAKLHLHKLRDADGNELFYFEIPFDKYLKSKSSQMN